MPAVHPEAETCVDEIIRRVGKRISIGMPLGLGKPVALINALYARACRDPEIHLRILTALTLEKPTGSSGLEKAFLEPFVERVFGDCPDITYAKDLNAGTLPANVEVIEFFFRPGSRLKNAHAQQHYISSNYTHAARDVLEQGCNVAAQLVCRRETPSGERYSLSSNPDTGPELLELLKASGRPHVVVAEVNQNLPYMFHDAEVAADTFDVILDNPRHTTTLFSTPKLSVTTPDYLIGLRASALIKDGGTLQIGIGALGDAIVHAAKLRQHDNATYCKLLEATGTESQSGELIDRAGGRAPFADGVYGATEMFVDGFMHLYQAGILKRRVYDDEILQHLLNTKQVTEEVTPEMLDLMERDGERVIRTQEFNTLQYHGLFHDDCRYELGHIIAPDGERIMANLAIPESREKLKQKCLGTRLRNGVVLHGGFFLGPRDFYAALSDMPDDERRLFWMTGVYNINQLDNNPALYKAQRVHARFINSGIMATLSGAVVSDGLADGRVISGVGGQYNFVAMAHQLLTGRSILMVRAVRETDGAPPRSNIVASYGHCTIPRHLRDIVVTEYGIADLRSRTDAEVAKAMLNVADSRFQPALLEQAKRAGKIEADYEIPAAYRNNTPEQLEEMVSAFDTQEVFPAFPLGCDFTDEERILGKALKQVRKQAATTPKWRLLLQALRSATPPATAAPYLKRMRLEAPTTLEDRVARALLIDTLRADGAL